jgi:hypothetical protein
MTNSYSSNISSSLLKLKLNRVLDVVAFQFLTLFSFILVLSALSISEGYSQVTTYPYNQNFNANANGWTTIGNTPGNGPYWTRRTQTTPSGNTGPNRGATCATLTISLYHMYTQLAET